MMLSKNKAQSIIGIEPGLLCMRIVLSIIEVSPL